MIYVDANATYPVAPSHYDDVAQMLKDVDGNPSSIHAVGVNAKVALENARDDLAKMFGCHSSELVFTSGATEGNNIIVQGVIRAIELSSGASPLPQVIISSMEHSAVREPAAALALAGLCELVELPVSKDGITNPEDLAKLVNEHTVLVCVMHVNNEVGAINDVRELARVTKSGAPNAHFHVDAVQMFGKRPIEWYAESDIDSAVATGHKVGGYKGIGVLYLAGGTKLSPLISGGGQERARRPGTENMPGVVSFGLRAKELRSQGNGWFDSAKDLADLFLKGLKEIPGVHIHGNTEDPDKWIGNTVNFHVDGVAGDDILLNFDLAGICASSGSACSSGVARPSRVLLAMGYSEQVALNSVRTSFTATGSEADVAHILKVLTETINRVKSSR
jgi:cysteine desulfurase